MSADFLPDLEVTVNFAGNFLTNDGINNSPSRMNRMKEMIDICATTGVTKIRVNDIDAKQLHRDAGARAVFKSLELTDKEMETVVKYIFDAGMGVMGTPYYPDSVNRLRDLGIQDLRVVSGDIDYWPVLEAIAPNNELEGHVTLGIGGAYVTEISEALDYLSGFDEGDENVTLMHTTIPSPSPEDLNFGRMISLAGDFFPCEVGYAPKFVNLPITAGAIFMNVRKFELLFDCDGTGMDSAISYTPGELRQQIAMFKQYEKIMSCGCEEIPLADLYIRHQERRQIRSGLRPRGIEG